MNQSYVDEIRLCYYIPCLWFVCVVYAKGKVIPLHAMVAHGVRGGIASTHS
jgi:hypothetical protein